MAVKVKRTYSLEETTVQLIERIAQATRRDLSTTVEMAVELYESHLIDIDMLVARPEFEQIVKTVDSMAVAE